jgi:archaellum component FlaC
VFLVEQLLKEMMDQMNRQFDKIDNRFDEMDQKFIKIDKRFDVVDLRFDGVEASIQSLKETVENNASEFRSHFRHIENKLEQHDKMFEVVSEELQRNWL